MKQECPICEEGVLTEHIEADTIRPRGFTEDIEVNMKYSTCNVCGSEMATPEQSRYNQRQILNHVGK